MNKDGFNKISKESKEKALTNFQKSVQERVARKKKKALECRKQGASLSDCAAIVGVDRRTLYYWKSNDKKFAKKLKKSWSKFRLNSVRLTAAKDPRFILSHIDKRFKEEPVEDIKNQFNQINIKVSNEQLAKWIIEIARGTNEGTSLGAIE